MRWSKEAKFKVGDIVSTTLISDIRLVVDRVYWSNQYGTYLCILDSVQGLEFAGIVKEECLKYESHDNELEEYFIKFYEETEDN